MKNDGVISSHLQSRIFGSARRTRAGWAVAAPSVRLVRGREAVKATQGMLVELSRRTGQSGAMDWLDFFITSPDSLEKMPYVLLVGGRFDRRSSQDDFAHVGAVRADDVLGAVLIYEYQFAGLGTKVFSTDDFSGVRTVIAPEEDRLEVAHAAAGMLMRMGALTVLISADAGLGSRVRWASTNPGPYRATMRTRVVPRYLPLQRTLNQTLATLGDDTRRNFRRYRRRATAELGAEFVPRVEMGRTEFMEFNRNSTNPVSEAVTEWRYTLLERTRQSNGTLFSGMRDSNGRWLSLIGGRRHGDTTEIDWQMNLAGLPRQSLCTVMRSYLMEHEIARGTTKLVLQGGTPHPMRFSFANAETTDLLVVKRWSPRVWVLRKFSRWIFPEKNFLGAALREL